MAEGPFAVPRWLEVLGVVMRSQAEVRTVVTGHGEVKTGAWLAAQHRYVGNLWSAVTKARSEGSTQQSVEASRPLDPGFSFLSPYFDLRSKESLDRHRQNIEAFWRAGMKPASEEVGRVACFSGWWSRLGSLPAHTY